MRWPQPSQLGAAGTAVFNTMQALAARALDIACWEDSRSMAGLLWYFRASQCFESLISLKEAWWRQFLFMQAQMRAVDPLRLCTG